MKRVTIALLSLGFGAFAHSVTAQTSESFKPSFNAGVLMHAYAGMQQKGYGSNTEIKDASKWDHDATLYRARIMLEAQLSRRDYVFIETELTSPLSTASSGKDKAASIKILDAQWDHTFGKAFVLSGGKMLVSHNRNGLQTASTLMANDFTYYQYPYNMSSTSPLQNDCGRDLGASLKGYIGDGLGYRIGAFLGRNDWGEAETNKPLRYVGRVEYNFLDLDKYSGTNLGEGKTFTVAAGFDKQGTYNATGGDVFIDYPVSALGSVTMNMAYSFITGGNDPDKKNSFATMIPKQNVSFAEVGYNFKKTKRQRGVKYERQAIEALRKQTAGMDIDTLNKINSTTGVGAGLNDFFNGYITNVKLSYNAMKKDVAMESGEIMKKTYGQVWLQVQLCLF